MLAEFWLRTICALLAGAAAVDDVAPCSGWRGEKTARRPSPFQPLRWRKYAVRITDDDGKSEMIAVEVVNYTVHGLRSDGVPFCGSPPSSMGRGPWSNRAFGVPSISPIGIPSAKRSPAAIPHETPILS